MNFIFFMPDELRAESVGCYGHPLAPTPNMDKLAAEGTLFEQCHVQHTVCSPSRCSMMTGWYPHVSGHRTLGHLLQPHEPNLMRSLRQAGYSVHWYGKNDLLASATFADSVDVAERRGESLFGDNPYSLEDPAYHSFLYEPYSGPMETHADYANVQAGIDFIESRPEQPFLLYLPLTFPHCPYSAPQPWHDLIEPANLPPLRPADLPNKPEFHPLIRQTRRLDQVDPALLRKIQAVYLGMTGYVDWLLGRLLDALDRSGLSEKTTVVVLSDHGDYAGDYGLVEKWPSGAEDVLTRIPLIVRSPGGVKGHRVAEPVELFDLMATTLDLAGLEADHTHFAHSLAPQLAGGAGDPERAVFCEGGYALHEPHCFEGKPEGAQAGRDERHIYFPKGRLQQTDPLSVSRSVMIRTMEEKLIYRPEGRSEYYDLKEDPLELMNRYGEDEVRGRSQALESRMLEWLVQTSDVTPTREDPRGYA